MNKIIQEHYVKNSEKLTKKAARFLDDWHYGQDCVHESYENALKYYHTFNGQNFDTWFFTIYVNMLRKYLRFIRSQGVNQEIKVADHPLFPQELVDKYYGLIKEEIEKFNTRDSAKQTLMLFFLYGYKGKEISEITGMSVMAINAHTSRFRKHLLERYEVFKEVV